MAAVAAGGAAASAASTSSVIAALDPGLSELNERPPSPTSGYPASQPVSPLVPSETQLAEGNLVLTEAQVAQRRPRSSSTSSARTAPRRTTTVLIRVRALGSYYVP